MSEPSEKRFSHYVTAVAAGKILSSEEAEEAFEAIMAGHVSDIQLSAFLTALHMRGETYGELLGAVQAVRRHMHGLQHVPEGAIDVCGTGGDGLKTLNVSTAVAFVLAGLGVDVAKHGGRALSSRTGATDVLEALGIPADADIKRQEERLHTHHLAFLAAPLHHPAMKTAAPVRKALGFRTLFNLLGPLCNPAGVKRQLVGVFDGQWCEPVARVLGQLGGVTSWAVQGETDEGPIDEVTLAGPTHIVAWDHQALLKIQMTPEMAGLPSLPVAQLRGGDAQENAKRMKSLLEGEKGCYRDTVLLNAAVALHIAGRGSILKEDHISPYALRDNIAMAAHSLDSGLALEALIHAQRGVRPLSRGGDAA